MAERVVTGYDEVAAISQSGPGRFDAEVSPNWTIGGKPNGGYLLALLGRAAAALGPHPHVLAASAHYLSAPSPGPVQLEVDSLRAGRSASQLRARLVQDGTGCVEALITTGTLEPGTVPFWDAGLPQPGGLDRADCVRIPGTSPTGVRVAIMDEVDLRIEPANLGFAAGRPSGHGVLRGWLALPDEQAFDHSSLLFAIDAFPPATFEIEPTGWVPTFELTAYVRALPAPGPVRVLQRAQLIDARRVDESCFVWDSTGRLVAQATQLAGIHLG